MPKQKKITKEKKVPKINEEEFKQKLEVKSKADNQMDKKKLIRVNIDQT